VPEGGIIRTLSLEGQLNLILAMQLTEHENYVNKVNLPKDISMLDIKKAYKLKDFILNNLSESITIDTLSTESGLNSKKLQACFRTLFDTSVNVYVRELKLDMACELLKTTDYSISEIVYNIGFKSRSYFSKIFFKRYNILPTEYRKRIKECD
uniref:helix-turn-helix domain-containing protein n=1 Tax=Candidatus Ulvibacter alkanivorans TaxID=2267620 RepID=UPI00109D3508